MIFKESLNKTQKAINYPTLPEAERKSAGLSYIDFLTREDFMKVSYEIIFLATPEDRLFFTTGDEKIDNLLFNAKENIIKIIGNLISYIKPHLHMKALENTDFLKLLQVITPLFLESLIELGSEEENAKFLSSAHRCQLISSVLSCSSQLVYIKEFHPIFEKYSLRIFTDIGFPFLRTLEEERNEAIDNPSEFVKLGLDT